MVWTKDVVKSLECGSHDNERRDPDTDVHLHYCKAVGHDVSVLRFGGGERIWVEHDDEARDDKSGMDQAEEGEAEQLLDFRPLLLELHKRGDWQDDDHGGRDEVEDCGTAEVVRLLARFKLEADSRRINLWCAHTAVVEH